jgi:WD40 repeat protein
VFNVLVKSELKIQFISYTVLVNSLKVYFAQDFYVTTMKMKNFLTVHTSEIQCISVTKDEKKLVSAGNDCSIKIWDMVRKSVIDILEGHTKKVMGLAISKDNRFIVS